MVATDLANPITRLECHGGAMGVVAIRSKSEVVVAANHAKPVASLPILQERSATTAGTIHGRPHIERFATGALPRLREDQNLQRRPGPFMLRK